MARPPRNVSVPVDPEPAVGTVEIDDAVGQRRISSPCRVDVSGRNVVLTTHDGFSPIRVDRLTGAQMTKQPDGRLVYSGASDVLAGTVSDATSTWTVTPEGCLDCG